jgi:hypothetical protein
MKAGGCMPSIDCHSSDIKNAPWAHPEWNQIRKLIKYENPAKFLSL